MVLENSTIRVHSPLSADECAKRITADIDYDDAIASVPRELDGSHDLIGRAEAGAVCLRMRQPSSYSIYGALFKPIFNGSLTPQGAGTLLEGKMAMHGFGRVFALVFAWGTGGFLTLMWVLLVVKMLLGNAVPGSAWGLLVIPLVGVAGYLYAWLVRRHAQADVAFVTRFLGATLQAGQSETEAAPRQG